MKRIFVGLALAVGMLVIGATSASASTFCNLDPTLGIGTPITYSLDVSLGLGSISAHVYASGTHRTTTFGGGFGL